jgi:prepilin-type processing-associated H-X9-DG protein
MVILAMTVVAVSALYRSPSNGTQVKATALLAASRLRDLRAAAMTTGSERTATVDVSKRMILFGDGHVPLQLSRSMAIALTGAASERRSTTGCPLLSQWEFQRRYHSVEVRKAGL